MNPQTGASSPLEVTQKKPSALPSDSSGPRKRRVISVVFCVPPRVVFSGKEGWKLEARNGYPALLDSLRYLSSNQSPWKHTIVGWTGEIGILTRPTPARAKRSTNTTGTLQDSTHSVVYPPDVILSTHERLTLEEKLSDCANIVPVWLVDYCPTTGGATNLSNQSKWRNYAEHKIYTLFHYELGDATDGKKQKIWWHEYRRMNELFADRIEQIYQPGDIIWVHDYQLLLLPRLLRRRLPHASIGFFLHTCFPSSEIMRCLSERNEILEGVLGANLIGFQSIGFSRHFTSCCSRFLKLEWSLTGITTADAHVAIEVMPIGIDLLGIHQEAHQSVAVEDKIRHLKEVFPNKKIIVGRDRLDTVAGVVQNFQAFEMFLDLYPDWRGEVVFIQTTSPPSIEALNDQKVSNKISELIMRIHGTYGSLSFTPVHHYPQYLTRPEYFALLRQADIGLITSARDGMNTTSMEYVICQKDNHGTLVLSEFSGTSGSLTEAVLINPWNLGEVADCMNRLLCMSSEERKVQHEKVFKQVTKQTVQKWNEQFLGKLMSSVSSCKASALTPLLDKDLMLKRYQKAEKRVFMFDYDGTLTPIVNDPQAAVPTIHLLRAIKSLVADAKNVVWIISGRDQAFLDQHLGHMLELGLSAEHGCFIRYPMNPSWESLMESADTSWRAYVLDVFKQYTDETPGSAIEEKKVALTWHYRNADPDYGSYHALQCRHVLEDTVVKKFEVEVVAGKANLEVRPRFVNKGEIAKRLISQGSGGLISTAPDFVLCLGDDHTDEDMFRAMAESNLPQEDSFACFVGPNSRPTCAKWNLPGPSDVISIIDMLNQGGQQ